MFLPVQVPTAVEHEGLQGSQGIAGLFVPVHALMFLSAGDDQVVAFFDVSAADVLALRSALLVVGDVGLTVGQVAATAWMPFLEMPRCAPTFQCPSYFSEVNK
jgi:hypothetical protein